MSPDDLDLTRIPTHIACVMDGNGRWARQRGLKRTEGHAQGEHALFDTIEAAREVGVGWFTVFAFSTENWKRPPDEVRFLVNFSRTILDKRRDQLHERNVRIRFIGRRDWRVPKGLLRRMAVAEELTAANTGLTFSVAFNYGGRAEIVDAVRAIVASGIRPKAVTENLISKHMYDPTMPDPDLMIRTSGEQRISNFLLWEMAYSELVFTDTLWPDFGPDELFAAIAEYQHRDRRYGAIS